MKPSVDTPFYQAALDTLRAPPKADAPWLAKIRTSAAETFRARGFPGAKDEAWRFTSVRPITQHAFRSQRAPGTPAPTHTATVIENGCVRPVRVSSAGVWCGSLAQALEHDAAPVEAYLAKAATSPDGFSALNTALFADALVVLVAPNARVSDPIHVVHSATEDAEPTVAYHRVLVVLGRGAEASLVETYEGRGGKTHLENTVTEVVLAENAHLSHIKFRGERAGFSIESLGVRQERDSVYRSHVATLGGALTRVGIDVSLVGPGAECALDGLFMARAHEHVDHHTRVHHAVARCASRQRYKGIVDGSGTGVFDGIVVVARDAQGTEAHQQSRNLILSADAKLHTKPHLEIDADDVKCSHGATVGALDEQQLFYLRSRGVTEAVARAALTFGFSREILDDIPSDTLRRSVEEAVMARLPHGELAKELSA